MTGPNAPDIPNGPQRVDKGLGWARFCKTRTLATKFCVAGKLRLNGDHTTKAHPHVRPGDVLTFPLGHHVRRIPIVAIAQRRGAAPEAQALYEDMDPPQPKAHEKNDPTKPGPAARRQKGAGRPTKRDRRGMDKLREGD